MRNWINALACMMFLTNIAAAEEYKSAVVKGVQQGKFVFEVDGREIQVSPGSIAFKAFDQNGRPLTELGDNFRIMKPGNVVHLITTKKRNTEFVQEIHLVRGELLEAGKPTTTRGSAGKSTGKTSSREQRNYTNATIKSVDGKNVILAVDGTEIPVMSSGSMKAFDASGRKLSGKGQNLRVLKEGNQVNVKTSKNNKVEVIREIHLVQGSLLEK